VRHLANGASEYAEDSKCGDVVHESITLHWKEWIQF